MDVRREIPAVGRILNEPEIAEMIARSGRSLVRCAVQNVVDQARQNRKILPQTNWGEAVRKEVGRLSTPSLRRVLNATGVILHTNLGRAPFPKELLREVLELTSGYLNLEFDLETGERGSRYDHCVDALRVATGAEDALVVNNNAAAVMLVLRAWARDREVVVSRGELVEIGGSFRIPEIMEVSGAALREVGTTNRTRLTDYSRAIHAKTALLLKVHPSNYIIQGFTESVSVRDLVRLSREKDIPFVMDVGTGVLQPFPGAPQELPCVSELIEEGVDLVTFSGDKLLGGPQAGIILGKASAIEKIRNDPWLRIVRVDKLTLAMTERLVRASTKNPEFSTVAQMLRRPVEDLRREAEKWLPRFAKIFSEAPVRVIETKAAAGGGSLPEEDFPSVGIEVSGDKSLLDQWERRLRAGDPAVVARRKEQTLTFDLRTLLSGELEFLARSCEETVKIEKQAQA